MDGNALRRRFAKQSAACALCLLICGCGKQEAPAPVVVDVHVATASAQDISEEIATDAALSPVAQAAIVPKIAAPVHRFYVQRGSKVKEGQLLATLENRDLEAAAMDSKGGLAQAQAAFDTATKASVPEDYQKAQLDLDQAKASLDVGQQIFNSRKDLFAQGAIPGRDLDTARVNLIQAQAQFATASKHLASLEKVSQEAALKSAQGQLDSAKGKYLGAQAQLGYSEIRSPMNGVVTERPLYAGEMPAPGAALITLMDTSALIAKAHMPQSQAQRMQLGTPAQLEIAGLDEPVVGKVTLISPAVDVGSTTVEVWVRIDNPRNRLRAGTAAHLTISGKTDHGAIVVPSESIVTTSAGKKAVMIVDAANKAQAQEVTTGIETGGVTEIVKGLKGGERVVTQGAYGLDSGATVRVVTGDEKESPEGAPEATDGKPGAKD